MCRRLCKCFLLSILLLLPYQVQAECNNSEKVKLSSLAQNITVTYDVQELIEDGGLFSITFSNLQPSLTIRDYSHDQYYNSYDSEITLYGYISGNTYKFHVYSNQCETNLYTIYVTLPDYNPYYNDPICNGITNSICQKWAKMPYGYDKFVDEVNKLKVQKTITQEEQNEEILGFYDYLIKIFINYYFIILPLIIILCITIIVIKRKKESLF